LNFTLPITTWCVNRCAYCSFRSDAPALLTLEECERLARAAHARGRDLELTKALDGMPLPVHPGAERFYRERGVRGR